jgi:hypothetical protein
VGTELFRANRQTDGVADRQADTTQLMVTFRNFANGPKMDSHRHVKQKTGKNSLSLPLFFHRSHTDVTLLIISIIHKKLKTLAYLFVMLFNEI